MRHGQSLIEILLAIAIAGLVLPVVFMGLVVSREGKSQQEQRVYATGWMHESIEAVRSIREAGWANVATNGTYHPSVVGGKWTLVAGPETVDGYTRSVVIANTYRDANGNLASSGSLDPSTKKVTLQVAWNTPLATAVTSEVYVTRYLENLAYTQTTQAEFQTGVVTNATVTNTSGGEITLSVNTKAKWCDPHLSAQTIDLPGLPNAVSAIEGHIFAGTGQAAGPSQDSFAHVTVANTDPPQFTLHGKLQGYKTYDVFGDANYGYITTSDNSKEVVIVNLNVYADAPNKIYQEAGYFNASGNTDADSVVVLGDRGYVAAGQYLYVFDLAAKTGSRPQIGNRIQFANSGDKAGQILGRVVGANTYVYIAIIGSTPEELKIADVTNSANPSQWRIVGSINIEPNNCSTLESGKAVYVKPDGSRAYISSVNDTTFKEFFSIDTSNKVAPSLIGGFATNPPCTNGGGYEAGGMDPEQSVVVSVAENRSVVVGVDATGDEIDSEEYQVLDLTNEANPARCGGFQYATGMYGVAGVTEADGDTFAYLITGDAVNELKVVQGGPDGYYVDSGVYESAIVDAGYARVFNRISGTMVEPPGTDIKFQVAIADPVAGSCAGAAYTYVGSDKTNGTYFTNINNPLPQDDDEVGWENPGQCWRIKAFLSTTDSAQTPILADVTLNFSP